MLLLTSGFYQLLLYVRTCLRSIKFVKKIRVNLSLSKKLGNINDIKPANLKCLLMTNIINENILFHMNLTPWGKWARPARLAIHCNIHYVNSWGYALEFSQNYSEKLKFSLCSQFLLFRFFFVWTLIRPTRRQRLIQKSHIEVLTVPLLGHVWGERDRICGLTWEHVILKSLVA